MKVTLFMASSINGVIATRDGKEDFLSHQNWLEFVRLAKEKGAWIYGRKTMENVSSWPNEYLNDLKGIEKVVISNSLSEAEGWSIARSPRQALELLKEKGFSQVILAGGAQLNAAFAKEGLIYEIVLNLDPSIVGEGKNIFDPVNLELKLNLIGSKQLPEGIVQLHYQVID